MGSTKIQQPSVPAAPSVSSSMADYVQNYPQLFSLMQQYAPQEAQMNVDLAQQYAQPMGEAYKTAQEAMYPQETAITNTLNNQVQQGLDSQAPDWMRSEYLNNVNSMLGPNAGSPIGADYASRGLMQMNKDYGDYYRNLGLSITGRQPIAQASTPNYTNQMSNYTPQGVMNYNSSNYGSNLSGYSSMYGTNANFATQNSPWNTWGQGAMQAGGQMLGGLSTGVGYGMMRK